ncbi:MULTISPECIES: hypothetical protein [Ensifer]|uniref:Uncharacterized protein n=1 Tax=Ensifer canadensis TaxID=555315 RepID=A0AAW4FX43_9HYPH|nr:MULTISPECIES: hypothetical protein [Ensifer]KQU81211.1 hypothetical protein ASD00_35500 [Ensifer sp. Root31]KQW61156.1 hypothetical protein ASD02_23825 [Ensifer sp. Root1252]KQW71267.1 hypothetical protein ASD03_33085 [Ensifer sp. Root127]KQY73960.1 hypothetical protein ASD52_26380 [Ensifer sp. Root142]KRC78062.1 hypothetical protein ASE32_28435 [Ensifer sp. Root231]
MANILEFPLTRDQRGAKERLVKAMREFNAAVKFAAKTGLQVEVSQVRCYATYSVEPLTLVSVAANIPGKLPEFDGLEF